MSKVLERRLWSDNKNVVNLLWFVASIVVAHVDVGVAAVIVAENVRGSQRVFHDEVAYMCPTLPGFKCEQTTQNFFHSQHTSTEQFLSVTRKDLFTMRSVAAPSMEASQTPGDPQSSPSPARHLTR